MKVRKQLPVLSIFTTVGKYQTKYKFGKYPHEQTGLKIYRPGDLAYFQYKQHRYYCKVLSIAETRVRKDGDGSPTQWLFAYRVQIINN
jgi:hypothetical protein